MLSAPAIHAETSSGRKINQPIANGTTIRTNLDLRNARAPLLCSVISLKKPATRKNNAMRNEWLTSAKAETVALVETSMTAQPI